MRRFAMGGGLFGTVAALLVAACGSSTSGNGGGATSATTPLSPVEFPAQAVSAVCDNIAGCCMTAGFAYDAAGCKAAQEKEVGNLTNDASLDGVNWDANAAGACVALLRQVASSCNATPDLITQIDATCQNILVGTKPAGAPCTKSAQCAAPESGTASCPSSDLTPGTGSGGASGDPPPAPTCQVQMPPSHAKAGDPCNSTCESSTGQSSCSGVATTGGAGGSGGTLPPMGTCFISDGVACDFTTFTCKPLAAIGSACTDGLECAAGSTCVASKCVAKGQAGEACASTSFDGCATGLYCDSTASKCAAAKGAGQPCTAGTPNECGGGGYCSQGKCVSHDQIANSQTCTGGSSTTPVPGMGTGTGVGGGSAGAPNGP